MNTAEQLMARGRIQGRLEGRVEGRVETLRTLLEGRFGPLPGTAAQRLTAATPEDLDHWTRRVLTAPTLDDVLA